MTTCAPRVTDLPRGDRLYIAWDTTGVSSGDTAEVSLEGGTWQTLTIGANKVVGYFAGPNHSSPSPAAVVPATSSARVRITTATERLTFDGGFIRLTQ